VHLVKCSDIFPYYSDGIIKPALDAGGTYLNDAGHEPLFDQVDKAGVVKVQ
jgi:hypothetical protein